MVLTLIDGVTSEEIPIGDYVVIHCDYCKQTNIAETYYRFIVGYDDRETLFVCVTCKNKIFPWA